MLSPLLSTPVRFPGGKAAAALPVMPRWLLAVVILACALLCGCQLLLFGGVSTYGDAFTYYEAWEDLKLLHPNQWRPPLYPLIVGGLSELMGREASLVAVLILQWAAYGLSLRRLWEVNGMAGLRRRCNVAAILSMLLIPGFWVMNNDAVAESLCGFGVVALIWLTMRYRVGHSRAVLLLCGAVLAMLVFAKPVFIFLLPVMALFWWEAAGAEADDSGAESADAAGDKAGRCRRQRFLALGMVAVVAMMLVGYAANWQRYTTVFGLTRASFDNAYYCARQDGTVIPEEIPDSCLREKFRPYYEASSGVRAPGLNLYRDELFVFTLPEKIEMAATARRNHPAETLKGKALQFSESAAFSLFFFFEPEEQPYVSDYAIEPEEDNGMFYPFHRLMIYIPLWLGWLSVAAAATLWLIRWRRSKRFPAVALLAATVFFCGLGVSVFGAQDSWGRLVSPFVPLFPLMLLYPLQTLAGKVRSVACGKR